MRVLSRPTAWLLLLGALGSGVQPSLADQIVFSDQQPSIDTTCESYTCALASAREKTSELRSPAGTDDKSIQFDRWSLVLGGERQVIFSGEFHPWRLPFPHLWKDVLLKLKAGGFNTISIYTSWALSQPSSKRPPSLTGFNDLEYLLQLAEDVGLYVIVRPGPYINAETTIGGVPGWVTRLPVTLRTNATEFTQAWRPYMQAISEVVKRHQYTWNGKHGAERRTNGSVIMFQIDNEYQEGTYRTPYMRLLAETVKYEWGVRVPLSYNDAGREGFFISLLQNEDGSRGPLDIWGYDSYPQRFDCSHPSEWQPIPFDYVDFHEENTPDQPFLIPEFQGGSYDPYGGPGYPACMNLTNGRQFGRTSLFSLWSQRAMIVSVYMAYGGTNWGGLADPQTYTSYDYSAALSETLQPTEKLDEYRIQGHFLRTVPDLAKTEIVSRGVNRHAKALGKQAVYSTRLVNPDTGAGFYFLRHADSTNNAEASYRITIDTSAGRVQLPPDGEAFPLAARQSDVIVTDFRRGLGDLVLAFSTCLPIYSAEVGLKTSIMALVLPEGHSRCYLSVTHKEKQDGLSIQSQGVHVEALDTEAGTAFSIAPTSESSGMVQLSTPSGNQVLINIYTRRSAASVFLPELKQGASIANPLILAPNTQVLSADYDKVESSLYLKGKVRTPATTFQLIASSQVEKVFWNGRPVHLNAARIGRLDAVIASGVFTGVSSELSSWKARNLSKLEWKYQDSLPEIRPDFDDAALTPANKTNSVNPHWRRGLGIDTEGQVLFAQEYGFHGNWIIWQGTVNVTEKPASDAALKLNLMGGNNFAYSVYLNDNWIGSAHGEVDRSAASLNAKVEATQLQVGLNRITIIQDHMGEDMSGGLSPFGLQRRDEERGLDESMKFPRGILSYTLDGVSREGLITWKVAGNPGGEDGADLLRTNLNTGGLHAEREGWQLPGFDTSGWNSRTPADGLRGCGRKGRPGVGLFTTTFDLDVPEHAELALSLQFPKPNKNQHHEGQRALIFVNGWQYGKYISRLGPQSEYYMPSLNQHGNNTMSIALWSLDDNPQSCRLASIPEIKVQARWAE